MKHFYILLRFAFVAGFWKDVWISSYMEACIYPFALVAHSADSGGRRQGSVASFQLKVLHRCDDHRVVLATRRKFIYLSIETYCCEVFLHFVAFCIRGRFFMTGSMEDGLGCEFALCAPGHL